MTAYGLQQTIRGNVQWWRLGNNVMKVRVKYNEANYRGADKSFARPGRKQATATEDFEFYTSYLFFRKWEGVMGTGWSWFRIGRSGGHLWVR